MLSVQLTPAAPSRHFARELCLYRIVNLVDAKTHRVVWRGEAADVLSLPVGDPADASQRVNGAVAKMFAKYPPQSPA